MHFVHRCLFDCRNYFLRKWFSQVSSCFSSLYRCSADLLDVSLHVSVWCSGSFWQANFYSLTFCDKQSIASKLLVMLARRKYLQCLGRNLFIMGDDAFPYLQNPRTSKSQSELHASPESGRVIIWSSCERCGTKRLKDASSPQMKIWDVGSTC